jgi:molybdate transport system ATP-binding protein
VELSATDIVLARRQFTLRASLSVADEVLALVGVSGAGKTSVLRILAGLVRPESGRIALADEVWLDTARRIHLRPEQRPVGYLPQDYALFPHLSVAGNVRFAAGRPRPDLLERFHISGLAGERPGGLSGGERQRVGLARALAREPRVLLLDEPFGALDTVTRRTVRDELAAVLRELRLPAVVVTHAFEDAAALGGRVGVIDHGEIVQTGSVTELVRRPATAAVAGVTGANLLAGTSAAVPGGTRIELDGGGTLRSGSDVVGRVDVAVHPWSLGVADPSGATFTDTLVNVRESAGALELRTARLLVRLAPGAGPAGAPQPGEQIGLVAAPEDVFSYPARGGVAGPSPGVGSRVAGPPPG